MEMTKEVVVALLVAVGALSEPVTQIPSRVDSEIITNDIIISDEKETEIKMELIELKEQSTDDENN